MQAGVVFNIQRYSVHDGPGIRTVVFLKGCPLRCIWCSNPESQNREPELAFYSERCLGISRCGLCQLQDCFLTREDKPVLPASRTGIKFLEDVCPAQAFQRYGRLMSVAEVMAEVEKDEMFYARSGGGMTLSGGEPLAQAKFSLALLRAAKKNSWHTAIETCGAVPWQTLSEASQYLDYIFFDLKAMNRMVLKKYTGSDGQQILENFRRLITSYPDLPVHVRTPIIPGINDNVEELKRIVSFLGKYRPKRYELLTYHAYGQSKYRGLGREYPLEGIQLDNRKMLELQVVMQQYGFGKE